MRALLRGRWAVAVLLVALSLRALVPHGYMPDLSGTADGVIRFVICSAAGLKVVTFNPDGTTTEEKSAPGHVGEPCAFASSVQLALPDFAIVEIEPPQLARLTGPPTLARDVLPPARAGPQLGSRGPPRVS